MKSKQLLLSLLSLLLSIPSLSQNVETTFKVGNINYKVTTVSTVSVSGVSSTLSGHVAIPETVTSDQGKTFSVTKIDDNAFSNSSFCKSIKAITLPQTITEIGSSAFSQCSLSDSLIIKGAITRIGNNAFKSGIKISRLDIYEQDSWWTASFGTTMSNPICFCTSLYCRGKKLSHFLLI